MNNNILNNLLSGISKSLNIADNIIPIYKDTYPLIKKGKDLLNKNNNLQIKSKRNNDDIIKNSNIKENNQKKNLSSNPKFFI